MASDLFMADSPATIDESGGGDLSHPVNRTRCQATKQARGDELLKAAEELQVPVPGNRCSRRARHWTHVHDGSDGEPFPRGRLALCTQHFEMIERRRRLGSADEDLRWWQSHAEVYGEGAE